jgi:hypothetical protein
VLDEAVPGKGTGIGIGLDRQRRLEVPIDDENGQAFSGLVPHSYRFEIRRRSIFAIFMNRGMDVGIQQHAVSVSRGMGERVINGLP